MLRKVIISLCLSWFVFLPSFAYQYQNQIDSLLTLLDKTSNQQDSFRVNLLNTLAFEFRNNNNQKALEYGLTARTLAQKIAYSRGEMLAETHLGWIYYRIDDCPTAFNYAINALRQAKGMGDKETHINNLNTIGAIYNDQENYDLAIEHLEEAVKIGQENNLKYLLARSCNNLCYSYIKKDQLEIALTYANKALDIGRVERYPYIAYFAMRNLGDIYKQKKEYEKALKAYHEVLEYAKAVNDNFLLASTSNKIAQIYLLNKQDELVLKYFKQAIKVSESYRLPFEQLIAYKSIAEIYLKRKNMDTVFYYHSRYVQILDSLYEDDKKSHILQSKFETEKKKIEIDNLEQEKAAQKLEIVKRNLLLGVTFSLFILSSVLAVLFFRNNKQRKTAYQIVLKQKNEITEQNEEIKQSKEELNVQAEHLKELNHLKDKILAIISHDLRSPVANLKNLLDLFDKDYISGEELNFVAKNLKKNVDMLYINLDTVLQWSYSQIGGLKTVPTVINLHELVANKAQLFEMSLKNKNLTFHNKVSPETFAFADLDQIRLVLRNLITNAIKFTPKGGEISISSYIQEDKLIVSVIDTGIGIEKKKIDAIFKLNSNHSTQGTEGEKGTGLGLLLCKEFVENNGGALWIESQIKKGTTFSFSLPLKPHYSTAL